MTEPGLHALSPDLSSSPPPFEPELPELDDDSGVAKQPREDPWNASSPSSPTLTLGHSSPELPALPSLPLLGGATPLAPTVPEARSNDGSSYYTASWGSPYQLPPLNSITSAWHRRSATASSDIDDDSPNPRFGLSHLLPSRLAPIEVHPVTPTRPSTPSPSSPSTSPPKLSYFQNSARSLRQLLSPNRAGDRPKPRTQSSSGPNWALRGGNWWNPDEFEQEQGPEVELQASPPQRNAAGLERNIEPFQLDGTADTAERTDKLRDKGHRSRDSNLTLTQQDFWPGTKPKDNTPRMFASRYADPADVSEPVKSPSPQLPTPMAVDGQSLPQWQRTDSTASVTNARPKKRVLYKGKSCWISIPQEPPRGTIGHPPVPLSPAAVKARLDSFESAGYDTRGFGNWNDVDPLLPPQHAQNRSVYPDPSDDFDARRRRKFRVIVPNRLAWKAYEDYLREEKLRALGVSLGGESDAAPMSRQSSQISSALPFSPPLPTSSAGSQRHGHHSSVFQTGFVPGSSNHTSTRSIASPISSLSNPRTHMHRQSMFTSPTGPHQGMTSPGLSNWSPQQFINQHGLPSGGSPAIPDFVDRRSPLSPFGLQQGTQQFPFSQRDELLAQMQRQKQQQMQMHLQQQQ
jgi:hypothetical protein